jgi:segregation and condensation protein A
VIRTESQPAYQVSLPVFEGPLDLLLHLIQREELDITLVSLAQVTNQFLEYLSQVEERDPDVLADFLVIAARLLLIKSHVLLPGPRHLAPAEDEETGEDLLRQLQEYKKLKEAATWLRELEATGQQAFVRQAVAPDVERELDLSGVTLDDLILAARHAFQLVPPAPPAADAVPRLVVSMREKIALLEQETSRGQPVSLLHHLKQATSRLEIVVTLLALLELVKQLKVTMRQDRPFGEIWIEARTPPSTPEPYGEPDEEPDTHSRSQDVKHEV